MTAPVSVRGLFRATGHASHVIAPREADDFYPTPPEPTRALLAAEGARLRQIADVVWEPAAGDGAMVREIEAAGFRVLASDLVDRGCPRAETRSFYDWSLRPAQILITNPPYCEVNARDGKGRWLRHAMALGLPYVALFLNADWDAAAGLAGLLDRHPVSRVYVCRWKVDFTGKGSPPQRNSWFIWDRDHRGETVRRYLDRGMSPAQAGLRF